MKYVVLSLFTLLLVGALYYDQERILFCDASHMTLRILNTDQLLIGEFRYGSFITHLVPFLGNKLHLSLSTIVTLYSLSFNLFYLSVAVLLLFWFRNYALALLMAFYYTLFVSDTYFWTNNEIHQAVAWMFLFFASILHFRQQRYSWWLHAPLFLVLAFFSLFTHPLMLIVVPFLWLFFVIDAHTSPYSKREVIVLSIVIAGIGIAKYFIMQYGSYDVFRIRSATHFSLADIVKAFQSRMVLTFSQRLFTHYYFVPILFLAGLYSALKQKQYRKVGLVLVFTAGYCVAMALIFDTFIPFYTESEWMPFTLIATSLFVYETIPRLKPRALLVLTIFIFGVRLTYIAHSATKFTSRKEWLFSTLHKMEQQHINKGYIYNSQGTEELLMMNWGVPAESLIASALRGDKPNRTFFVDSQDGISNRMAYGDKAMIDSFGPLFYDQANPFYFNIDTAQGYFHVKVQDALMVTRLREKE